MQNNSKIKKDIPLSEMKDADLLKRFKQYSFIIMLAYRKNDAFHWDLRDKQNETRSIFKQRGHTNDSRSGDLNILKEAWEETSKEVAVFKGRHWFLDPKNTTPKQQDTAKKVRTGIHKMIASYKKQPA